MLCAQDRQQQTLEEAPREFDTLLTFDPVLIREALDQRDLVVQRYRPDRAVDLRSAQRRIPSASSDLELIASLMRELIRYEEQLHVAAQTELVERRRAGEALHFLASARRLWSARSNDHEHRVPSG